MAAPQPDPQWTGGPEYQGQCTACKFSFTFHATGPMTDVACPQCHAVSRFKCDAISHEMATIKCIKCGNDLQFNTPTSPVDVRCFECGTMNRYTPPPPPGQPNVVVVNQPQPTTNVVVVEEQVPVVYSYGYYGGGFWATPFGMGYYGPTWTPWYGYYGGGPCYWGPRAYWGSGGAYCYGGGRRPPSPMWHHGPLMPRGPAIHPNPGYRPPAVSYGGGHGPVVVSHAPAPAFSGHGPVVVSHAPTPVYHAAPTHSFTPMHSGGGGGFHGGGGGGGFHGGGGHGGGHH